KTSRRTVRSLPATGRGALRAARNHVLRRARTLRAGNGSAEPVLRDGGQSGKFAGQPVLGIPAERLHQGPGADYLLVVPGGARRLSGRWRGFDVKGPRLVFVNLFPLNRWG